MMRISDWSSDVCPSDLLGPAGVQRRNARQRQRADSRQNRHDRQGATEPHPIQGIAADLLAGHAGSRSEEHTYELQSLMRNSYAVFCLKKQLQYTNNTQ